MKKTALLILTAVIFISCSSKEKVLNTGERIQHDDFEYSVQDVKKLERIGTVNANGYFYMVTFQVENKAKRVDHEWTNSTAYLVDGTGKVYENSPELQRNLQGILNFTLKDKYVTPAGKTESTVLVFEVPAAPQELFLKVRGGFLMGDLFDGNQFKNTKIKISQ
jgi:hypothetical protein